MEIFVMSAAGIYDWPIIKQVSWLLGQVMNGIYNALSAIGIENIGVAIIVFTIIVYTLLLPLTIKQQKFTKMSAGQPRLTQLERFRQRFMHKLVYYPTNNDGLFSCVGCGRCLAKCPIQMNIVKVIKKLGGKCNA